MIADHDECFGFHGLLRGCDNNGGISKKIFPDRTEEVKRRGKI